MNMSPEDLEKFTKLYEKQIELSHELENTPTEKTIEYISLTARLKLVQEDLKRFPIMDMKEMSKRCKLEDQLKGVLNHVRDNPQTYIGWLHAAIEGLSGEMESHLHSILKEGVAFYLDSEKYSKIYEGIGVLLCGEIIRCVQENIDDRAYKCGRVY